MDVEFEGQFFLLFGSVSARLLLLLYGVGVQLIIRNHYLVFLLFLIFNTQYNYHIYAIILFCCVCFTILTKLSLVFCSLLKFAIK